MPRAKNKFEKARLGEVLFEQGAHVCLCLRLPHDAAIETARGERYCLICRFRRCRCLSFFARGMAQNLLFRTEIPSRSLSLGLLIRGFEAAKQEIWGHSASKEAETAAAVK